MVMMAEPLTLCLQSIHRKRVEEGQGGLRLACLSPQGTPLTQQKVRELSAGPGLDPLVRALRSDRPTLPRRSRPGGDFRRRLRRVRRRTSGHAADRRGGPAPAGRAQRSGVCGPRSLSSTACSTVRTTRAPRWWTAGPSPPRFSRETIGNRALAAAGVPVGYVRKRPDLLGKARRRGAHGGRLA
jgi:hypothetical protein